jgi:hypothetical protein
MLAWNTLVDYTRQFDEAHGTSVLQRLWAEFAQTLER